MMTIPEKTTNMNMETPNLQKKLIAKLDEMQKVLPPEAMKAIGESSVEQDKSYTLNPLPLGATAPMFSLPNATNNVISLDKLLSENKAIILTWYRGGWCPFCNIALHALTESNDEFIKLGARLVALTPETPDESLTTVEKNNLKFDVLSDVGSKVADKFGVAFEVTNIVRDTYKSLNIVDFENANGNTIGAPIYLPAPATFVLDKNGKLVYCFANKDYTKRAEPADIIKAVQEAVA